MWGGDLYSYITSKKSIRNAFGRYRKKKVISKIGHLITYIKGDYELAQKWYGAKGKYHECFMYPSNLYKEYHVQEKQHTGTNILVGNSADPSNNHLEVLDKLEAYKDQDITIYVPLSYGNQDYAKQVIAEGKKRFGDRFQPLTEFMPFEKYLKLLGVIDIAIFNHKRQQAMGNTITLLGLGKKVYMRSDATQWVFFQNRGIKVFDIEEFEITEQMKHDKVHNQAKVREHFSVKNYTNQLQELFH